jgi:DNA-binding MarR family transcriptional regulator
VCAAPGLSLSAAADRLSAAASTVRYHVRVLEREGLLETRKVRGNRVLLPADRLAGPDAGVADPALSAALEDDARRDVLVAVSRAEPASVSELAGELDRARSTVSHHLQRLAADGLVDREREGRAVLSSLTPAARSAVERSAES